MNAIMIEYEVRLSRTFSVSGHATERARERLGWRSRTTERMAMRALDSGIAPGSGKGPLKLFLSEKLSIDEKSCPFLYGGIIYVFGFDFEAEKAVLLTLYRAPRELLNIWREPKMRGVTGG